MNREILFRGKRLYNGEWVYGFLVYKKDPVLGLTYCFIVSQHDKESFVTWYKVDPFTVGQYTDKEDTHGNRIFEGDIWECLGDKCFVAWDCNRWVFRKFDAKSKDDLGPWFTTVAKFGVVVGNIHDGGAQDG